MRSLDYQYQDHEVRLMAFKYLLMPVKIKINITLKSSAIVAALLSVFDYSDWTNP